jgi:hypothetical protein
MGSVSKVAGFSRDSVGHGADGSRGSRDRNPLNHG